MSRYFLPNEIDQNNEHGYVIARDAIPRDIVVASRNAMWTKLGMSADDPATWPDQALGVYPDGYTPTLPCRTPMIDALAEQLIGPLFVRGAGFWPVLSYPRPGPRQWMAIPGEHIDGPSNKPLYPNDRYLVILCYLTDTESHGGALAVRPGSHHDVFSHYFQSGQIDVIPDDIPSVTPFRHSLTPIVARAGDVVLLHYLTSHSSSWNHASHVRVALNGNAGTHPLYPYQRKHGAPQSSWTPLDITLRTDHFSK